MPHKSGRVVSRFHWHRAILCCLSHAALISLQNKRGYLPEKVGFVPMILMKQIGELHKPNDMYLEYVPEEIVEQAVDYLLERFGPKTATRHHTSNRRFSHAVTAEMAVAAPRSRL